ncbi:YdeI/OmpD-associated family protein [Archangium lansingense]|uniref:YdeI/OmpD-associated family protein n=1 Tax=Archangium lansingense TaxID=2995310 RepID=UPI003B811FA9
MSPTKKKATTQKAKTPAKKAATAKKTATAKTPKKEPAGEIPTIAFSQPSDWADWLASNHASSRGLWLKLAKKASGVASVTYPEALEVALAWGWIDGQKASHDDSAWLQKFTPRGPKSIWSKINREKALALIEAGKMKPPGLEQVERAKQDGRWEAAYDSPSRAAVPEDLSAALAANPRAAAFFATLNSANRYAVLFRIHTAKKAETRTKRITQFVEMLARHEKLHP